MKSQDDNLLLTLKRILLFVISMTVVGCQSLTPKLPTQLVTNTADSTQQVASIGVAASYITAQTVGELAAVATTIVIGQVKQENQVINKARNVDDTSKPDLNLLALGQVYRMDVEEVIKGTISGSTLLFVQSEGFLVKPQESLEPSSEDIKLARQDYKYIPFLDGHRYLLFLEPLVGFESQGYYINIMPHPWRFDVTDSNYAYPESPAEWLNIRPAPLNTILEQIRSEPIPTAIPTVDSPLPTPVVLEETTIPDTQATAAPQSP